MEKYLFIFLTIITFSFVNFVNTTQNNEISDFPIYNVSLTFDVGICSCTGSFMSC